MQIKNFEFRPGFKGFVVTLIAVCVFGYLAIWQIGRADQRKQQQAEIQQQQNRAVEMFSAGAVSLEENRYQRFRLSGRFQNDGQLILDNMVLNGKVGYQVITPFLTKDQTLLLVDRGWVKADPDRRVFPDITVDESPVDILVSLDKPRSAPVVGAEVVEKANRWNYLDLAFYRDSQQVNVPDYLLLLSPETGPGYQRQWPGIEDKSAMHIGYAIQWAAFALIALGTYIGLSFKKRGLEDESAAAQDS